MRTPSSSPSTHNASVSFPHLVGGRHELGQNFLVDPRTIDHIVGLAATTSGPIVELGAGSGALTRPLARLRRPLTALEIDPARAAALQRDLGRAATVVHADALAWRYPGEPHVIVGNVPFHLTTAILRTLLERKHWTDAILLTQWEVARRRCGVGGSTLLTAQWDPWFAFGLHGRVPARSFRPMPSVDGGLFTVQRREAPLVGSAEREAYQAFVGAVFRGRGRGLAQILTRTPRPLAASRAHAWLRERNLPGEVLPGRLSAADWAFLWEEVRGVGRGRRQRR